MSRALQIVAAALLLVLPAMPQATARWQRSILPPRGNPTAEQCVVVDADLYAHAAPGLRDVRLLQDGAELPYAMDVSFDTRVGEAAPPPADDRAEYDTVEVIPLQQTAAGSRRHLHAEALLSAHVPVERIRLDPAPGNETEMSLRAAARMNLQQAEQFHLVFRKVAPVASITLGANLQDPADLTIDVADSAGNGVRSVILEMRRREICYHPRSASPLHLLLGDAAAQPAHYEYALHFQPAEHPLLAAMGPMAANPNFAAQPVAVPRVMHIPGSARVTFVLVIVLGSAAVIAFAVYELRRR